ncbi:putative phosphoglycerate mutase [Acidisarcina polymorpha]|uniref:Putative phosphoglycerate mutase n=1 Tax=Acidisarcina polymorpha TaxID=2211140 RepID=A0A2Z5G590_9BACT|nr:histidine phosphatase family protein [Acidisarcina polymorpha]AXC14352.1 putative phosphoglycerate mutase [Acidisarcina polymorpha]
MPASVSPIRLTLISAPATRQLQEGIFLGDEGLDASARAQLERVRWTADPGQKIWVSPEARTRETAKALGVNAEEAPELRECDFGLWRGRSLQEIHHEDPVGLRLWIQDLGSCPHRGESFLQLMERVGEWLDLRREAGSCVVITHASVIRAAIVHALSAPQESFRRIELGPLTLTDIRQNGAQWHVRSMGVRLTNAEGSAEHEEPQCD